MFINKTINNYTNSTQTRNFEMSVSDTLILATIMCCLIVMAFFWCREQNKVIESQKEKKIDFIGVLR